jgi:hypothetical protein
VADWFQRTIVDTGRLPLLFLFVAVIVTFGLVRLSVRMIRAGVRWWPGNVSAGGLHVHHVVFGVVLLVGSGVVAFALPDRALAALCVSAALFGVGVALVLDEFALVLHLEDVYWAEAGRSSVDAVFVALAVTGLLLLGVHPGSPVVSVQNSNGSQDLLATVVATAVVILLDAGLAALTLLKGKLVTGLLGLFVPPLLVVGAIRVARPHSPWARWRYRPDRRHGVRRMAVARRREARYRAPVERFKIRFQDLVAGRPNEPPGGGLS